MWPHLSAFTNILLLNTRSRLSVEVVSLPFNRWENWALKNELTLLGSKRQLLAQRGLEPNNQVAWSSARGSLASQNKLLVKSSSPCSHIRIFFGRRTKLEGWCKTFIPIFRPLLWAKSQVLYQNKLDNTPILAKAQSRPRRKKKTYIESSATQGITSPQ